MPFFVSNTISPLSGARTEVISLNIVLFPMPESPPTAINSPLFIVTSAFSSTGSLSYLNETFLNDIKVKSLYKLSMLACAHGISSFISSSSVMRSAEAMEE